MFGHGGGQVVVVNFPAHPVESRKRMDVTSYESLETLAVGELQIRHPAVPINQREGIQFTLVALIAERAEVTPVHLETLTGLGFHAHEGTLGLWLRAHLVDVLTQDAVAAVIAEGSQALLDDRRAGPGVLAQQFG